MLLKDAAKEFEFNCKCRKLSDKTIKNYSKLISYLLDYLKDRHMVLTLEDMRPVYIKGYIMELQEQGKKPQYINDQIKAFKVLFRYLYEEGYTDTILTDRIKNVKMPKTIIQTFTEKEVKDMVDFYHGQSYMQLRDKLMLMTFFDTGIRVSELIGMKLSQIKDEYNIFGGSNRISTARADVFPCAGCTGRQAVVRAAMCSCSCHMKTCKFVSTNQNVS